MKILDDDHQGQTTTFLEQEGAQAVENAGPAVPGIHGRDGGRTRVDAQQGLEIGDGGSGGLVPTGRPLFQTVDDTSLGIVFLDLEGALDDVDDGPVGDVLAVGDALPF